MIKNAALLIIDVQVAAVRAFPDLPKKIEKLQDEYEHIFASAYTSKESYLPDLLNWGGYDDESLAFIPAKRAKVWTKTGYTSFISDLKAFKEVHICGFDTDACVYKTALDLVEAGIRPVVLAAYCGSENTDFHNSGLKLLKRNIGEKNVR